ncbi:efflux RND transporter permease subunit [Rhodopirellula sallentina]|nr:MMPL family transporter [Rhodopirellula sallentina]
MIRNKEAATKINESRPPSQTAVPPLAQSASRFASRLVRMRVLCLLVGCLCFLPMVYYQSGLTMNRSLAAMFADDDEALLDYQHLQSTFGGNLVVMLVYDDDRLMTAEGLHRNRQWTEQVESTEGVEGVLSVAKLVDAFRYLRPEFSLPFAGSSTDKPIALFQPDDNIAEQFRDLFAGYTHSNDETTAAIVIMLQQPTDENESTVASTVTSTTDVSQTVTRLRRIADEMPPSRRAMLVGEPVLLEDAFDLILSDGRRLAIGTIGLLCVVILLTLRDARVVILAAACIVWSTVATRSIMVFWGIELSLVSAILLALVAVVVVAAIMHLAVRCHQTGSTITAAIAALAIPITCTCLTDAAGFAALMVSEVRPVIEFGFMTATAACCVLVSLALFSPMVMSLPEKHLCFARTNGDDHGTTSPLLRRLAMRSVKHHFGLGVTALVFLLVTLGYVMRLETNSSFLDNFRRDSSIVQSYARVEERLGGAGVWDVVLPAPSTITPTYFERVRELEDQLRKIELKVDGEQNANDSTTDPSNVRLSKVLSLADADEVARQVTMLSFVTPDVRLAGMRAAIPTFAEALLTFPDTVEQQADAPSDSLEMTRSLRIMLRSNESLSGKAKAALMSRVRDTVQEWSAGIDHQFGDNEPAADRRIVTGYSVLMSRLVASLIRDQWKALGVALVVVGLLIWGATYRFSLTVAALIVNTLPILIVLSAMGIFGGQLDLGSATIGAVSIGLSIDGSIHFLSGYQRRKVAGYSTSHAAVESAADLGAPILLASAALVIGFAVLVTSPFVPTATFGLLVAATLAISAAANLTLLPALVVWFERRQENATQSLPENGSTDPQ